MEECLPPPGGVLTLGPVPGVWGPSVVSSTAPRAWGGGRVHRGGTWLPRTWMQVPVHSLHRLQDRAQRLAGMCEILVMGSIFSGQPMLTCAGHRGLHQASSPPNPQVPTWEAV